MAGRHIGDEASAVTGDGGADYAELTPTLHEHRAGAKRAILLIAKQRSAEVDRQRKAAGTGLDLGLAERQHGRANIGVPQNRAGMCDAEWIEAAGLDRQLAADLIGGLRRVDEADKIGRSNV